MEKMLFLLKHEFKTIAEPSYEFIPFKLGPFSAVVLEDAKELDKAGLILIKITGEIYL